MLSVPDVNCFDTSVAVDFSLKFLTSSLLTCCAAGIQFVI